MDMRSSNVTTRCVTWNLYAQTSGGNFVVGYLHNGTGVIYIHSKVFIADDEFALIGSSNIDQKSMTHDSELKIGVVEFRK